MQAPILVWFRRDLRLRDNPALFEAAASGRPVLPVYVWSPEDEGAWAPGGATKAWLGRSLLSLEASLRKRGSRLVVRRGSPREVLAELIRETGAKTVHWNRLYDPATVERDRKLKLALESDGIEVKSFNGALLYEPWEAKTGSGRPYQVFTPFWKAVRSVATPSPALGMPKTWEAPSSSPASLEIVELGLSPRLGWDRGFWERFEPGEEGARRALETFGREAGDHYHELRDLPSRHGTSRLSPHLHFGEISPRQAWDFFRDSEGEGWETFRKEFGWREFAHHVLFHFPESAERALRPEYRDFPWAGDPVALEAWRRGRTGYPVVDAGMRELWATGWMHNRVRMVVASFLTKHLLHSWIEGARWFWDTLVDADLANNTLGWQWAGGCGADAAPYFRVFNPILQGEKFDPNGEYVRRWVPELVRLPNELLHRPFEARAVDLATCGIELGRTYPRPVVDHAFGRQRALAAFEKFRKR